MKKGKKIIVSILAILFISAPAQAGCPLDVEGVYTIENLECSGDCENLLIRNRKDSNVIYYQDDCQYCDSLELETKMRDSGRLTLHVSADFQGDHAFAQIYQNGETDFHSSLLLDNEFWEQDYEIGFRDRLFSVQFSPHAESGHVEKVECLENCENIKVVEKNEGISIPKYDSCPEANLCSAITIYSSPSCGGGYDLNLSFKQQDSERILTNIPWISNDELKNGPLSFETNIGESTLTYQLAYNPEESAERVEKIVEKLMEENISQKTNKKKNSIFRFGLIGLTVFALTYYLYKRRN